MRHRPPPGLMHHSDRGSQYASAEYQALLARHGIVSCMSRKANCGVDAAADELASDRRDPNNTPVMIVLTDGLSNPRPAIEPVNRAREAKLAGAVIYATGLGETLDFDALEQIASAPELFFRAPDA